MDVNEVKKGLFRDSALEKQLLDVGYIVAPFFLESELEEIQNFYFNIHPDEKINLQGAMNGIHMTTWSGNYGYKKMVERFLENSFSKGCARLLKDHRIFNSVFIAKEKGNSTQFTLHQDWTVVDESKDYSINIWVPLKDVDENNGAVWLIPNSHKLEQPIRGAGCLHTGYNEQIKELENHLQCVKVKAGEALIFFHTTVHGSPANLQEGRRVVACCTAVRKSAELRTFFQPHEDSPLEVYRPEDNFVFEYEDVMNQAASMAPKGELLEKRSSYKPHEINIKSALAKI
ncbi:MAG: hypothetical protein ACI9EQ_000329 [Bacteroidia bacterium]|jgi:hypothetical protein